MSTTRAYYRSGYAFVLGPAAPRLRSFSDPALQPLRIGIPLVGDDDYLPEEEAPPGQPFAFDMALGTRHEDTELLAELDAVLSRRVRYCRGA